MASSSSFLSDVKLIVFTSSECELDFLEFLNYLKHKLRMREEEFGLIKALMYDQVDGEFMYFVGTRDERLIEDMRKICRTEGNSKFLKHYENKIYVTFPSESRASLKKVQSCKEGKIVKLWHKNGQLKLMGIVKLLTDDYGGIIHDKVNGIIHHQDRTFIQCNNADIANTLLNVFSNRKMRCIISYEMTEVTFLPPEVRKRVGESSQCATEHLENVKPIKERLGKPVPIPIELYRKRRAEEIIDSDDSETPSVFLHKPKRTLIDAKSLHNSPSDAEMKPSLDHNAATTTATLFAASNNLTSIQMFQIGILDTTTLPAGKWKIVAIKEE